MRRSPPTFRAGPLSTRDADELNESLRSLYRLLGNFTAVPPLAVSEDAGGVSYRLDQRIPTATRITFVSNTCIDWDDEIVTVEYTTLDLVTGDSTTWCEENPTDCCPGSDSGDQPPVITECCPGVQLPAKMCLTFENISGCACIDGWTVELDFVAGSENPTFPAGTWSGLTDSEGCAGAGGFVIHLACRSIDPEGGAPFLWYIGDSGFLISSSEPAATTAECDPFSLLFDNLTPQLSSITGCEAGTYRIRVTPGACLGDSGDVVITACCPAGLPQTMTLVLTNGANCTDMAGSYVMTYHPELTGLASTGAWLNETGDFEAFVFCDDDDHLLHLLIECQSLDNNETTTTDCSLPIVFGAFVLNGDCCNTDPGTVNASLTA